MHRHRMLLGATLGLLLAVVGALAAVISADPDPAAVDAVFAAYDSTAGPGCALGVYRGGETAYARGYGMANLEYDIAISPRTVFRIGSTSKQFTAMVLALLAEGGKLDLDDDIHDLFPEFPAYGVPVTYRQLAHHTSGMRDYLTLAYLAEWPMDYPVEDTLTMIARQQALNFEPGTAFIYSNTNYFLISQIVERLTGQSLKDWAEAHVFGPLGMHHTHFHDDHRHIVPLRADGYAPRDGGGYQLSMTTLDHVGDGGIYTTIEDFWKWHENFGANRLGRGGQDLIDLVTTPGTLANGESTRYGFGLNVDSYGGLPVIRHGGAFVGFRATALRFPANDLGIAIFCNVSTAQPDMLANRVADLYLAEQLAPEAAQPGVAPIGSAPGNDPDAVALAAEELRRYAGSYWNAEDRNSREIVLEDGRLVYRRGPDSESPLQPIGAARFRMLDVPVRVIVTFEAGTMVLEVDGQDPLRLERYEPTELGPDDLAALAGTYYSPELDHVATLALADGKLINRRRDGAVTLEPTIPGVLQGGVFTFTIERNADGAVTGLLLDAGRVRNLRYGRR